MLHDFGIAKFGESNGTKGVLPVVPAEWRRVGLIHKCFLLSILAVIIPILLRAGRGLPRGNI